MSWSTPVTNPSSATSVERATHARGDWRFTSAPTRARNPSCVTSRAVQRNSQKRATWKLTRESTMARSRSCARIPGVTEHSRPTGTWVTTLEGIQVRDHLNATPAPKVLWDRALWKFIWDDTQAKNHLNAPCAARNLPSLATSAPIARSTLMPFPTQLSRIRIFQARQS